MNASYSTQLRNDETCLKISGVLLEETLRRYMITR